MNQVIRRAQYPITSRTLFVLVLLCGLGLSPAISLLMNDVIIRNTGIISSGKLVTALSGSPKDIQAAVDAIAGAGGGIVYVPEGNFAFDVDPSKISRWNLPAGVIIPGGVSVIGAGRDKTILYETKEPPYKAMMFMIDGLNGKPVRISGIKFIGYVKTTEDTDITGLGVLGVTDFRIDHCSFEDFSDCGIGVSNHVQPYGVNRGVIDHCDFDNPYKDNLNIPERLWGYGICIVGTFYNWEPDINKLLGKYDGLSNVCYIEDCSFRRCRHALAGNGGAHYVARNNYFTEMIVSWYGSYIDAHGASGAVPAVGTRLLEIYDNNIIGMPTDYRSTDQQQYWGRYMDRGIGIRGGALICFNNLFKNTGAAISLYSDAVQEKCKPHDIWIWNNTFDNCDPILSVAQPPDSTYPIVENQDYFLYARPGYIPYPYPHPLTLEP